LPLAREWNKFRHGAACQKASTRLFNLLPCLPNTPRRARGILYVTRACGRRPGGEFSIDRRRRQKALFPAGLFHPQQSRTETSVTPRHAAVVRDRLARAARTRPSPPTGRLLRLHARSRRAGGIYTYVLRQQVRAGGILLYTYAPDRPPVASLALLRPSTSYLSGSCCPASMSCRACIDDS
jgi:hypothetical protein